MPSRKKSHRWIGALSVAAVALGSALAPAARAADRPGGGDLSPRLAELAKPALRTASRSRQARALGIARKGPGSLVRDGSRVLVEVRFDRGAAAGVEGLRAAGARVVDVSRRYQTVTVAIAPANLPQLAAVPRIAGAREVLAPVTFSTCPAGVAVSEGDVQLRAAEARTTFGADGTGVTVGVLSDSFDRDGAAATNEADDVESGDLPGAANTCPGQATPVGVLDDSETEGEDEGRAMAQIVHDLAPGAELSFATAFTGLTAFAGNVEALATAGAEAIVDDVSYFEEPFFQEGPVGVAVSKVTGEGVSYFSSAGNNNLINGGRDVASWETPEYRDSGGCPAAVVDFSEELEDEALSGLNPSHCIDFNPGSGGDRTFRITVSDGATLAVDLQWAEPWEGVSTDLDAFLLSAGGQLIAAGVDDNVGGSQRPFEFVAWENETGTTVNVQLVVNRYSGDKPLTKFVLLQNGGGVTSTEYPSSQGGDVVGPTIFGHNGAEDATSVGAIRFSTTVAPESFSSRGPVTHYFEPVEGTTAAAPLTSPQILSKPDVTATDCGATTFFAAFVAAESTWRFCGTSAAAPHVAAVAALMLEQEPTASPAQIRAALWESADSIGSFGTCAVGAGLVDAVAAFQALLSPGPGTGPACEPPESGPVVEEGDGEPPPPPAVPPVATNPPTEPPPEEVTSVRRPRTRLLLHPPRVVFTRHRKATVVFRFGAAGEGEVTFVCRVDGAPFRPCRPRLVRRFGIGPHVVRVIARNAAGLRDLTPAVFRFRVKQRG